MKQRIISFLNILFLASALLLNSTSVFATIIEFNSFSQIPQQADQKTWVIFDIDNTLIKPTTMIGSHQWGDYIKQQALALGKSANDAKALQDKAFGSVQAYVPITVLENEVYSAIDHYKKQSLAVFALTARPIEIKNVTLQQLLKVNISFKETEPLLLNNNDIENRPYFSTGVLFSGTKPKGELLKEIIANAKVLPSKIIFFDDRLYNLQSVESSLANSGIEFTGYRYSAADQDWSSLRSDISNIQWILFQHEKVIYNDQQALEKLINF